MGSGFAAAPQALDGQGHTADVRQGQGENPVSPRSYPLCCVPLTEQGWEPLMGGSSPK